jgi:hypothetical protein
MKHDDLPMCLGCGISHTGPQNDKCMVILEYRNGTSEYGWQAFQRRAVLPELPKEVVH